MEFLVGYDSDEEDPDSDEEQIEHESQSGSTAVTAKATSVGKISKPLPSPDEILNKSSKSSIFKPSFGSDLNGTKILEKHVKMVENKNNITEVNGRKVCWMYRQGRCRAGKKCSMYHDSELRESTTRSQENASGSDINHLNPASNEYFQECSRDQASEDDVERKFRKKRYGVTNNLEPPKKALRQIEDIRRKEKRFRK